jgi:hypothetical protein
MVCKIFKEEGDYLVSATKERINLVCASQAWTPEGLNVGWTEFNSVESACQEWGLEYLKLETINDTDINE